LIAHSDEPHRGRDGRGIKTAKGNTMSKKTETKALPAYRIFSIVEAEGEKATWHELGAAWKHKDGKGFNLQFKALPLPGAQVVLREPKEPKAKTEKAKSKGTRGTAGRYDALKGEAETNA
jgi:hypothetical protein